MIDMNLGIDKNGVHTMELTQLERDCLDILQARGSGKDSAISATELTAALGLDGDGSEKSLDAGKRNLRVVINHLIITHSLPIMCEAGFGGGYYIAGEAAETERFKQTFHRRAMTGLVKASRGSKAAYVDMMFQYTLGFDDPETRAAIERLNMAASDDPVPAWVQLVTKLLDKMSADPQRYAAEIRRIQATYGEIFVPREKVRQLKEKTAEFQKLLSEIQ